MLAAKTAGFLAIGSSTGALLTVCFYLPALITKIGDINEKLKVELDEFQVIADEAWTQVLEVKAMPIELRQRRQAGYNRQQQGYGEARSSSYAEVHLPKSYSLPNTYEKPNVGGPACACSTQNNCPAGPRGAPGKTGDDGIPGIRGDVGPGGLPGITPPPMTSDYGQCRSCPQGPRGPSGSPGESGASGPEGASGPKGRSGDDGRPGYAGNPGQIGEAGASGKPGDQGPPGLDGVRGEKGPKGEKGPTGAQGPKGPVGFPGNDGQRGNDGAPGHQGLQGHAGPVGQEGQQGIQGSIGQPGQDAHYCPCPNRNSGVNKPENTYAPAPPKNTYNQGYGEQKPQQQRGYGEQKPQQQGYGEQKPQQQASYGQQKAYEQAPIEAEHRSPYHRLVKI